RSLWSSRLRRSQQKFADSTSPAAVSVMPVSTGASPLISRRIWQLSLRSSCFGFRGVRLKLRKAGDLPGSLNSATEAVGLQFNPQGPFHLRIHDEMIRKLKSGKYRSYSRKKDPRTRKRRNLDTFTTRAQAKRHEKAVQYFKHH